MTNKGQTEAHTGFDAEAILPDHVPVALPVLPPSLRVHTVQQFKALGDPTRSLILQIIKHEPLTAKQLGERLHVPASTVGHHLQVLEAAGLAQICARRLVHGIVAKYYVRTALLFVFDFAPDVGPVAEGYLRHLTAARDQLADLVAEQAAVPDIDELINNIGFPHARISKARVDEYAKRLFELVYEFATESPDPDGQVYGLCTAFFVSPSYLQGTQMASSSGRDAAEVIDQDSQPDSQSRDGE
jgi:Predicted transcriptional regulator